MRFLKTCLLVAALFWFGVPGFSQLHTGDSLYTLAKKEKGDKQAAALRKAAEAYQQVDAKKAIAIAEEALQVSVTPEEKATCELTIGVFHYFTGAHEVALEWYLRSLATFEKSNNKKGQARVLNEIGTLIKKQGDLEKSADYFQKALTLSREAGDSTQVANSMNNLGIAMEILGKTNEALELYTQSANIKRSLNDFLGLSYNLDNLGMLYTTRKQYEQAEASFSEAAKIRLELGDRRGYGVILNNIGEMWQARNNPAKALDYFTQALAIAEETNYVDFKRHLYNVLATAHQQQQHYEKAVFYLQKHQHLKDSIFNEQKSKQLLEMETKYETEKKELKIQEQELKLERNRTITIGLVVVLFFVIIIVVLWRNQLKLREQKRLEQEQRENQERLTKAVIGLQEKERSRFAQDLHDGFGQLITALKMQFEKTGQRNDGISELVQHMHDEIRNVSFALSPQVLVRDGLVPALKELSFRINRSNSVTMGVQSTGLDNRLNDVYETALYRVCQEWINNVLKYSGATKVDVQLIEHEDEIMLMIEDNGNGFTTAVLGNGTGNGWKNIQSRVQILNGRTEIDSHPERKGTTFTVTIPKQEAPS